MSLTVCVTVSVESFDFCWWIDYEIDTFTSIVETHEIE